VFGRHVPDEKVPTEKWHTMGLKVLNTAPAYSRAFNKDFHDAVALMRKGVFDQKPLITHKFRYGEAQSAFMKAAERPADYIKGVITF
jgi:threonine dehydrogenase-like Zn-dependent dehydrogenase